MARSEEAHWLHINIIFVNFANLVLHKSNHVRSQAKLLSQMVHVHVWASRVNVVNNQF